MRRFVEPSSPWCAPPSRCSSPAAAQASTTQSLTFEAPRDLKDPATRDQAFSDIASLGVHSMRLVLYWHDVAPEPDSRVKPKFDATDPASYDWGAYDAVVDGDQGARWNLLLTVSGPVPRWATNGARDTLTRPSPAEFQKFVHRRRPPLRREGRHAGASGTSPTSRSSCCRSTRAHKTPLSPGIYRKLFFAAQRGLADAGLAARACCWGRPRRAARARSSRR